MSRSSASEALLRRGQVEPTAAIVATVAVCLGLSLYAVALDGATPAEERDLAEPTLRRVHDALARGGVVSPNRSERALAVGPPGRELNLTIEAADERWTAGPPTPTGADRAARRASVMVAPGRVRAGTLRVEVWT